MLEKVYTIHYVYEITIRLYLYGYKFYCRNIAEFLLTIYKVGIIAQITKLFRPMCSKTLVLVNLGFKNTDLG